MGSLRQGHPCGQVTWKRYKRVQDTTAEYFVYDGANVVDSYASNGNLNARYITPGLDGNLSMTRSGSTYYYMADGLGSVRNVVDSSEAVQNTYDYYAFGNTLGTPTTGVASPYEYTAREFENGGVNTTFYYRNRYYMSGLGIFMSRDAMWADMNRGWGYVGNNALLFIDPFGWSAIRDAALERLKNPSLTPQQRKRLERLLRELDALEQTMGEDARNAFVDSLTQSMSDQAIAYNNAYVKAATNGKLDPHGESQIENPCTPGLDTATSAGTLAGKISQYAVLKLTCPHCMYHILC